MARKPIEQQINDLPAVLQRRMARFALAGWRFEHDDPTGGWHGWPPGIDDECIWGISLHDLMKRMGDPQDEEAVMLKRSVNKYRRYKWLGD